MASQKIAAATAVVKIKKDKPLEKDELLLQELQKIRKTFVDVSLQVSKQLTSVMDQSA